MTHDALRRLYADACNAYSGANLGDSGIDAGLAAVFEAGQSAERAECAATMERLRILHADDAELARRYETARNAILIRDVQPAAPLAKVDAEAVASRLD